MSQDATDTKASGATGNIPGKLACFAFLLAQLALVLAVMWQYHLAEGQGIERLLPLILGGFAIHTFLPRALRLPFFVLLTMAGIFMLLGPTKAAWLIAVGLGLIGLCHLPVPFVFRVLAVLLASGALALCQAGKLEANSHLSLIIPVLGTLFMFRLVLYLYDIRHERKKISPWQRIAYFFLLPNPVFPLFPVVDYKTYLRTYYQREDFLIYQKGILWMARGCVHLLLYRLVYYYLTPTYEEVTTLASVAVFTVTAYLLYLQISGLFHLAVGILCLFGFDLPETHRLYMLASGFNDYWRRINIYWKEFMAKIVFFPVFMRARKFGQVPGLVIATGIVFLVTWLLHSYQHFWLQGTFPITAVDAVFWGIFGLLVIINTVHQAKRPPAPRALGKKTWNLGAALRLSVQTAAMFVLMCLLWSMWTTPKLGHWLNLMGQAVNDPLPGLLAITLCLIVGIALGTAAQYAHHRGWKLVHDESAPPLRLALAVFVPLGTALALLWPNLHEALGAREVVKSLRGNTLNRRDQGTLERGYYEGLLVSTNLTSALAGVHFEKADEDRDDRDDRLLDPKYFRATEDLLYREYLPSLHFIEHGKEWSTNAFGMRDREYALEKPADTTRLVVLGASFVMGKWVADGEPFESILEELLNRQAPEDRSYEIMNMGVDAYTPLEGALLCRDKIGKYKPDYMFFIDHTSVAPRISYRVMQRMVTPDLDLEYPLLKEIQWRERVFAGADEAMSTAAIHRHSEEIISWAYGEMVARCREQGIHPVWVLLPRPKENSTRAEIEWQSDLARKAGFTVLELKDPYRGHRAEQLTIAEWDYHPNALGHRLIAESLYDLLEKNESDLKLGITRPRADSESSP